MNSTITGQIQTSSTCRSEPSQSTSGADFVLSNVTVNDVSNVVAALDFCTPDEGTFTLRNTIVQQCHANLISQGYNFVQPEGCVILGDLTGVVVGDDPILGSLKDNGGPTFTRLPVASALPSTEANPATPAAAASRASSTSAAGVPRLLGLFCDIGAVEGH
ncbi:MAG: choice-of-anchor Q domain-containing protein [Burkholderiaceae bacterium]